MDFTFHQLKVFLKVVEKTSVTRAAEELHLTQPAISIQLKKFQDQFEIPLFEVIGRKIFITDFGHETAKACQRIIWEVNEIKNHTLAYKGFLVGQLKLSVVSTGKYVMPYFLSDFCSLHPQVDLKMDVTNKSQVVQALEKNTVDFALVSVLPQNMKVDRIELMQNKLFLTRKFTGDEIGVLKPQKSLKDVPLIYREEGSATRQAMERFIADQNVSKHKSIELTSNEAVKQSVVAGLGYSVLPLIGLKNELTDKDIEIVPSTGLPIITQWNLIWLQDKKLSPISKAFLGYIQENKGEIISKNFSWYEKY